MAFILVDIFADIAQQTVLSGKTPVRHLLEAVVHLVRRRVLVPTCETNPVLLGSLRRGSVENGDSLTVPQANGFMSPSPSTNTTTTKTLQETLGGCRTLPEVRAGHSTRL